MAKNKVLKRNRLQKLEELEVWPAVGKKIKGFLNQVCNKLID